MSRPRTRFFLIAFFALVACIATCFAAGCGGGPVIRNQGGTPREDPRVEAFGRYIQGLAREQAGDLEGALEEFARAHKLDPCSATIAARLGTVLYRLGRNDEATPHLATAEKAAPENAHLALALTRFYAGVGRGDDALRMCKIAAASPQYRHEALLIKAEVLFKQGKNASAGEVAAILAQERGSTKDRLLLGRIFEAQGKPDEAAEAFLHAARASPEAAMRASQIYAQQGNYAQATDIIRRFLNIIAPQAKLSGVPVELPPSPRSDIKPWTWQPERTMLGIQRTAYVRIAWIALSRKNHSAAEAALVESLDETGEYFEACEFLGDIERDAGRNDSALKHYRKALSLNPPQSARNRIEEKIASTPR
jgi:tetratricopeptide (TPR) repeat protein